MPVTPPDALAPLVACPDCQHAENLNELSIRYTYQSVYGLRADGSADDYQSFDYGDDVLVTGYSCACGWFSDTDIPDAGQDAIAKGVEATLAAMARVVGCEPTPL